MPSMVTKKVIQKKVNGTLYSFYPRSSADIIEFTSADGLTVSNVESALRDLISKMGTFSTGITNVPAEIQKQVSDAVALIMGTDDQDSINQALNSIKELAEILGDTEDENHATVEGLITTIGRLKTEVEAASTGLLARTTTLENQMVNGYDVSVDDGEGGTTTQHYDGVLTRLAAVEQFNNAQTTDDVPDTGTSDRHYVTTAQITKITNSAIVQSVASDFSDFNDQDLYFVDVAAASTQTEPADDQDDGEPENP